MPENKRVSNFEISFDDKSREIKLARLEKMG